MMAILLVVAEDSNSNSNSDDDNDEDNNKSKKKRSDDAKRERAIRGRKSHLKAIYEATTNRANIERVSMIKTQPSSKHIRFINKTGIYLA